MSLTRLEWVESGDARLYICERCGHRGKLLFKATMNLYACAQCELIYRAYDVVTARSPGTYPLKSTWNNLLDLESKKSSTVVRPEEQVSVDMMTLEEYVWKLGEENKKHEAEDALTRVVVRFKHALTLINVEH